MFFYTFMPKLFNMTLTASVAIVLVILLRLLLRQAPKVISYALWGVVLFRLLCPASIGSSLSLYNLFAAPAEESGTLTSVIEYVPTGIGHADHPSVDLSAPGISDASHETVPQGQEPLAASPLEPLMSFAACTWMSGVMAMAVYSVVSYIQLRRKLTVAVPLRDNIFIADDIKSPFVVGLFRPKIYLPCNLEEKEQGYIVLHERHHIKRLDHIMKALAFLALSIHWFNPLVWAAFILADKDMEMSCDEAVIRKMDGDVRADYSASLLTLATGRRIIAGTPLAFGEGDTKGRINNLSQWKQPAIWIVVVAGIVCAIVAVCVLTNPIAAEELGDIKSVTVDNVSVSEDAADALLSLINSHRRTAFVVGLDDPSTRSRAVRLNCANGDFYLLHYQQYSGFSFDPLHGGEDDHRSILTFFDDGEGGQKAWRMEYDFNAELKNWLSEYAQPNFGALAFNQPYGVVEVIYESPLTDFSMVAQVNTPQYILDENHHLFSALEYSDPPNWTDLGEVSEITITEEIFDGLFRGNSGDGWMLRETASGIRKDTAKAWRVIYERDRLCYILQQKNGELYLADVYCDYPEKDGAGSDDTHIRWLFKIAPVNDQMNSFHEEPTPDDGLEKVETVTYGGMAIDLYRAAPTEEFEYIYTAIFEYEGVRYDLSTSSNDPDRIYKLISMTTGEAQTADAADSEQAGGTVPMANVLGFTDYSVRAEEGPPGFFVWHYYAGRDGRQMCIAEQFGYLASNAGLEVYGVDLDGDEVPELICNGVYGTGAERVVIYRNNDGIIEQGRIDERYYMDELGMAVWGSGDIGEKYDPAEGAFVVTCRPSAGSVKTASFKGLDNFTFLPYDSHEPRA